MNQKHLLLYLITDSYSPCNVASASISFSFDRSVTRGAILLTKDDTQCFDVLKRKLFETYLLDNYESWFNFARQEYPISSADQLRLVTGFDSTNEFSMLAFAHNQDGVTFDFQLSASDLASAMARWGSWKYQCPLVFNNWGPQVVSSGTSLPVRTSLSDGRQPDQCIFVRTLRVCKRPWPFAPRVIKASAEPKEPGSEGPPDSSLEIWVDSGTTGPFIAHFEGNV